MNNVITIYDVAERLGLSPRTVSRYFNRPALLAEKTRRRITDEIERTGFRPSVIANRLSTGVQETIGVIASARNPLSELHRLLLGYFSAYMAQRGKDLLLIGTTEENESRVIEEHIKKRKFDVLLALSNPGERIVDGICQLKMPWVTINWRPPHRVDGHRYVGIDYYSSSFSYVKALLNRGHRSLAYLSPYGFDDDVRGKAVTAAIAECPDAMAQLVRFPQARTIVEGAESALLDVLRLSERPDLVYCYSDHMALALLAAAHRAGLRIPDDLAIVGFDGLEACQLVHPQLTTVEQPWREMAGTAAEWLTGDFPEDDKILPTCIRWGGSCR